MNATPWSRKKCCFTAVLWEYEWAQKDPQLRLLDINPFLYEKEGVFRDVFREYGLHLTDAGYEQAKFYLAQKLLELL